MLGRRLSFAELLCLLVCKLISCLKAAHTNFFPHVGHQALFKIPSIPAVWSIIGPTFLLMQEYCRLTKELANARVM